MTPWQSPCGSSRARHRRCHPQGILRFGRFLLVTRRLRRAAVQKATEISCTPETQRLWRAQDRREAAHVRIARANKRFARCAAGNRLTAQRCLQDCHEEYSEIESTVEGSS